MLDPGYLLVDFSLCQRDEVFGAYQDLGVLCAEKPPSRVLLRAADEDADAHYALRDVLDTVARIEGSRALCMKVALVTFRDDVARVGVAMQPELRRLGCKLRVFRGDRRAARWLRAGVPRQFELIPDAALA